jgi:hypothetical protein
LVFGEAEQLAAQRFNFKKSLTELP